MNTTTKLNLDQSKAIAIEYFASSSQYQSLDVQTRSQVICGSTIEGEVAKCSFYIPGLRPELGKVLLVLAVNRLDASVREISENEF